MVRNAGASGPWTGSQVEEMGAWGSLSTGMELAGKVSPQTSQMVPVLRQHFPTSQWDIGTEAQPWGGACTPGLPPW